MREQGSNLWCVETSETASVGTREHVYFGREQQTWGGLSIAWRGTAGVWLQVGKPMRATGEMQPETGALSNGLGSGGKPRRRVGVATDDVKGETACGDVGYGCSRGESSGGCGISEEGDTDDAAASAVPETW